MATQEMPSTMLTAGEDSDDAAVAELVSDIEAELRLHLMRVQEFLDGTGETAAVTEPEARDRLMRLSHNLHTCIDDIGQLAE